MGFIKKKYIGRSFIQPTKEQSESDVRIKLNVIGSTVKGLSLIHI